MPLAISKLQIGDRQLEVFAARADFEHISGVIDDVDRKGGPIARAGKARKLAACSGFCGLFGWHNGRVWERETLLRSACRAEKSVGGPGVPARPADQASARLRDEGA
ncbi:MAG: hypothetical protein ACLP8A_07310 [Methylovirgula sp.]